MLRKKEEKKTEEKKEYIKAFMSKLNSDNIFESNIEVDIPENIDDLKKEIKGLFSNNLKRRIQTKK